MQNLWDKIKAFVREKNHSMRYQYQENLKDKNKGIKYSSQ